MSKEINKEKLITRSLPYFIFSVVIILILSYQLRSHTAIFVSDSYFHFSRFYDAAQQISNHNFSFFQTNWGFDQSGRIINALYGPYFAYLMGAILLLCGTWFKFQILTTFCISLVAANGIYKCLKKISNNQVINTLITLIYITSINLWSNGTTFNSISSALILYVLYCGLGMIQKKKNQIIPFQLALVMSIVVQIHVLSTVLSIILLIPFFIFAFVESKDRKNLLLNLIIAIGITVLLTLNISFSLFYFHSVEMVSNPIAVNMYKATISIKRFVPLSMLLMAFQFIFILTHFKRSKINTFITLLALSFLVIGTKLFPWNTIQTVFPILREAFQMPRRLFILVTPLYLLGTAITFNQMEWRNKSFQLVPYAALFLVFLNNYSHTIQTNSFYVINSLMTPTSENRGQRSASNDRDLNNLFKYLNVPAPDYLPKPSKKISSRELKKLYKSQIIKRKSKFIHSVLSAGRLKLEWSAKNNDKIILPITMYKHSILSVNGKKITKKVKTEVGAPIVDEKIGKNEAILHYQEPKAWKWILIINLLSWLSFITLEISKYIKRKI